ncbi:MAG: hypothetical protein HY294_12355 [Candidatus Rokubacteria bacterium]|nr:hypothetical protein [Candidatus Rokubacteria bacterium]MBI3826783.1 hypothetical protein [Candidatus Rokubacteria bacterium]
MRVLFSPEAIVYLVAIAVAIGITRNWRAPALLVASGVLALLGQRAGNAIASGAQARPAVLAVMGLAAGALALFALAGLLVARALRDDGA